MQIIILSEAKEADLERMQTFIDEHNSPFIITHSLHEQREAIKKGLYLKIEDSDNKLVAIGSVIEIDKIPYYGKHPVNPSGA